MKTIKFPVVLLVLVSALVKYEGEAGAAESRFLPFQGRLSDANGNSVADGAKVIQFKIYDAPIGGRAVWNGEVQKLTVNGGMVNTLLGTKSTLSNVDFDKNLYLELTIDANDDGQIGPADPPLLPRQSIVSAVFAKESADSRLLRGYDWSALFGTNNPAEGTLLDSKIGNGTLTSAKIRDGAITLPKLNLTGALRGQTLQYNGSAAVWGRISGLDAADGTPTQVVAVDNTGNVDIGASNPAGTLLTLNGGIRARGGPPGGLGVNLNGYAFSGNDGDNDSGMFSSSDGLVQFFCNSLESMRITQSGAAILGSSFLEFGYGVPGKEANAGRIGYGTFSGDALDIVGAGTPGNRRINFYAEGGVVCFGAIGMFDSDIRLRALGDGNHFLGWRNEMGNQSGFDGPALVGNAGGVLGTRGGTDWSLRWFSNGQVRTRGSVSQLSDRNAKENFVRVDSQDILTRVLSLPITHWNYKSDPTSPHVGPVSQDFHAAFGLGSDEHFIDIVDEGGIALVAIQGLHEKLELKDSQTQQILAAQQRQMEEQQRQLEALKAEIVALKAAQH